MLRRFCTDENAAVTVDWVVLSAAIVGLGALVTLAVGTGSLTLGGQIGDTVAGIVVDAEAAPAETTPAWNPNPDFILPVRRLPMTTDHPTLWANPFHSGALPPGFPAIGGQDFTLVGDGNPRLLVAGADPRVISGAANPQFDVANYAAQGTAHGNGGFHRILIDTPPPNTTHRVQLTSGGKTIEYHFANIPY